MKSGTRDWNASGWKDGDLLKVEPDDFNDVRPGVPYGTLEYLKFPSTTVGKDRDVVVWLPPEYDGKKCFPVLYLFHGLAKDQTMWASQGNADLILGNMIASGEAVNMILVMPNCRARKNDARHPVDEWSEEHSIAYLNFAQELKLDLMPFIESRYAVALGRKNTAIAGYSMGGRVALHTGILLQDKVGYIGTICPAPGLFDSQSEDSLSKKGAFHTEDELRLRPEFVNDTYMAIFAGKDDESVHDTPEQYHNVLVQNGCPHEAFWLTGGHSFSQVATRALYRFAQKIFK